MLLISDNRVKTAHLANFTRVFGSGKGLAMQTPGCISAAQAFAGVALIGINYYAAILHAAIDRTFASLGGDPNDVLLGIFNVTGFTVNAVFCVDL